jgi:hypothetical protein
LILDEEKNLSGPIKKGRYEANGFNKTVLKYEEGLKNEQNTTHGFKAFHKVNGTHRFTQNLGTEGLNKRRDLKRRNKIRNDYIPSISNVFATTDNTHNKINYLKKEDNSESRNMNNMGLENSTHVTQFQNNSYKNGFQNNYNFSQNYNRKIDNFRSKILY